MAVLRITPPALEDLERLAAFLHESDPAAAAQTVPLIIQGIRILEPHPLIGRPLDEARRELVVFRGRTGYLVQYRFDPSEDQVVILAVRHQRELDS